MPWTRLTEDNWHGFIFMNAKRRAKKKDIEYTITKEEEEKIIKRCGNKCELTDHVFEFDDVEEYRRPFIPSLDRIDSSKGYTFKNVRIVTCVANNAIGQFGTGVFNKMISGYIKKKLIP